MKTRLLTIIALAATLFAGLFTSSPATADINDMAALKAKQNYVVAVQSAMNKFTPSAIELMRADRNGEVGQILRHSLNDLASSVIALPKTTAKFDVIIQNGLVKIEEQLLYGATAGTAAINIQQILKQLLAASELLLSDEE